MRIIQGTKISFRYNDGVIDILEDIQFRLDNRSRVGLVGDNGVGKSTLIKILTGDLIPTGQLVNEMKVGTLNQEIISMYNSVLDLIYSGQAELLTLRKQVNCYVDEDPIIFERYQELDGWNLELKIEEWFSRFLLPIEMLDRQVETLSGGEKTKINLISLLISEPDIMIMDEPTNHLDLETVTWLENFLIHQKLPYLIISHDREFLDRTVETIWELADKKLEVYSGNYSFYKKQKDELYSLQLHQYEVQRKKVNKLKKSLSHLKGRAIHHQPETGDEGYAPVYEELQNLSKKSMRYAKVMENRINQMIEKEECKKPQLKEKPRILFEEFSGKGGKNCLTIDKLFKSYERPVLSSFDLIVKHGERVAIIGRNGSGKTTLLKLIAGLEDDFDGRIFIPDGVKISYYAQEYENLDLNKSILDEITGGILYNQHNIRRSLASVGFPGDEVFRTIGDLSPGERSKVSVVKVMLSDSNLLIMDEPTNHLEISTREVVEEALSKYKGTIIFVSHDRRFVDKLATRKIELLDR